jgi:hypothetical protein
MSACCPPSADYQRAYEKLYGGAKRKARYRRDLLPNPHDYYRRHLHVLGIHARWAAARCPFHKDRNPSLRVNLIHGGFICHGCGVKGGDVLAFHIRLKAMGFVAAAKALGAWEVDH